MTTSPDNAPQPISFEPPGAADGPTRAADCNWVGWRMADARATGLQTEKDQLQRELRTVDAERARLAERVSVIERTKIVTTTIGASSFAVAGILGGFAVVAVSGEHLDLPLFLVTGIAGLALLIIGIIVQLVPLRSHRAKTELSE